MEVSFSLVHRGLNPLSFLTNLIQLPSESFRHPNSPALVAQNLVLRDQRTALKCLLANAAAFGGDPNHMIMGGQSAGAGSSHSMEYAYPNDPIVKGLILESGSVEIIGAHSEHVDSEFERVATTVGCINANRTTELDCMLAIDAETLKHAISNRMFNYFGTPAGGTPMVTTSRYSPSTTTSLWA